MDVSRVDPSGLDESAIGFRLGPRLNAAGRLYRADAGLELLLTEDRDRARAVAQELDRVNAERRDVETRIRFEAEALVAEHPEGNALVLAAEGWHPGVIGIVASRIAERHHRPAILIALDGEEGSGSGRSIRAFDLLGGLHASAGHLLRYGGHKAAAGLTIARSEVDAFREAFLEHAGEVLSARGSRAARADRRGRAGRRAVAGPRRGAADARAVRHGQPGRLAARPGGDDVGPEAARRGPPRRVHAQRRRRPLALRLLRRRQLAPGRRRRARRRRGQARDRPLERLDVAAAGPARGPSLSTGRDRHPRRARLLQRRAAARARPRPGTSRAAVPARGRSAICAERASPACSGTSWPAASRCSPSARTRHIAPARSPRAWAGSR